MKKLLFLLLVGASLCLAIRTKIFIWDRSGPYHYFPHPDMGDGILTTPAEQYRQAFARLNQLITSGSIPAHETLDFEAIGTMLPDTSVICQFNIIVGIFGWPGSGSIGYSPVEANILRHYLETTQRIPGGQHALIFEGNDLASKYADTSDTFSSTWSPDTSFLVKYFNVVFNNTLPAPHILYGAPGTCFEGFYATYHFDPDSGGPDTLCDDVNIYTPTPWTSHARYAFNSGLFKEPARGIVRRTYSPGATILFNFTTGNIEGENARRDLMKRATDFAICPLGEIIFPLTGSIFDTSDVIWVRYWHYDNYLVATLKVKFSFNAGGTWTVLKNSTYPSDADTMFQWFVPNIISNNCYMSIELTDDAKNFYADTIGPFSISAPANTREPAQNVFLNAPFPNPFNLSVSIPVDVGTGTVIIRDINGKTVKTMEKNAVSRTVVWDGKDETGEEVSAGLYLIDIQTDRGRKIHKVIFAP